MSYSSKKSPSLQDVFSSASGVTNNHNNKQTKRSVPLTIRVTASEKDHLKRLAGKRSISAYVRHALLGDKVVTSRKRKATKPRQPEMSTVEVARLLGMFGKSELATSVLALSLAAQSGALDVTPEIEDKLESACDDIQTIKLALILALGVKPQGGSSG
jgi:hypothetical protein